MRLRRAGLGTVWSVHPLVSFIPASYLVAGFVGESIGVGLAPALGARGAAILLGALLVAYAPGALGL